MEHPTLPYDEIKNFAPGSVDPHARIKHLDRHGVDKTFLFPTLGLGWEAECEDPALSAPIAPPTTAGSSISVRHIPTG